MKKIIDSIIGIAGLFYLAWLFDVRVAFRLRVHEMTGEHLFGVGLLLAYIVVWTLTITRSETEKPTNWSNDNGK